MRKLLAAALVGAALLGAGWLGASLVAPYEAEALPTPAGKTVEKLKDARPAHKKTWAEHANGICSRALEDTRAIYRDAPLAASDAAPEADVLLRLMGTLARVEGQLLRELKRVRPSPAERRRVSEVLAVLADGNRHHLATTADLEKRWQPELLEPAIQRDAVMSADLQVMFAAAGATSCAAYFDPESY